MHTFYIAMGQGIVAKGPFAVCTSTLYSCTLISAHNITTNRAGAFHYPALRLSRGDNAIREAMATWIDRADPSEVVLTFPTPQPETPFERQDREDLINWVKESTECVPDVVCGGGAGMVLDENGFRAGRLSEINLKFDPKTYISLERRIAGAYRDYGDFWLFGVSQ